LPRDGINHTAVKKQHEAVAAVDYGPLKAVCTPVVVRVTDVGGDIGCQGRAAEEYGRTIVLALVLVVLPHTCVIQLEEDALEREREEVRAQEAVVVNGGAPRRAHAAGCGELARREAAEDVQEHVQG
jgi:hypothetical protein